ncbi:helicase ARIP4 isoform X1 [Puntigrus tetrazona]|uniref:helicase ARIP4 isoform X1 n=1 Tax=Puntigrus tetrazona TaxID=1606681 RepID=UPI001C8A79D8|nr:helicase ARIP4 isoform X1 [Puntigrus tetrazona]XP_043078488.1 helicase ARIP4 isoform X1 [Puntigrus tetrazona]
MSEEAISGSDLEPSLNSEEEEEMEEEEDGENDGDDEDDAADQLESPEAEDQRDPPSPAPTSPTSGDSSPDPASRPPSQPSSTSRTGSQPPSSPDSRSNTSANSNTKKKKSKTSKPAHLRRNIRKVLKEHQLEAGTKAAQQEELERRRRLEQQRKDFPLHADLPTAAPGPKQEVICLDSSGDEGEAKEAPPPQLPAHRDDVIELSSGDEDALRISSEEDNSEDRSVTPGTDESSGSHVNDSLNQPDAQGRVLVNINHPGEEEDLFLAPQLARAVKPHQIGGIRFLYDNLVESLERYRSSSGFGCILAHSMGLGKTLQVISFIDVLLRHTGAKTVLAIVPVNTLQNWLAEFNLWLPAAETLPPDTDPAQVLPRTFKVHILNDEHKTTVARAKVVEDWTRDGGVLLMGYEMYRLLSLKKSFVTGRKRKSKKPAGPVIIDLDEEDRQQELMKGIERAISRPGPDVVICDEGHRIKNCHASTSQALKNIRSRRRVVLTGYPLQNNLIEYWCMVDFVRPDFLGTRQEFSNMFERPILNGQCIDSTPQDVQLMRYRSHVLHSLLEGFVQRRGHDVLRNQLPAKEEHVILVRLSRLQRALYTEFMNRFREAGNTGWLGLNPLKAFCVCCKIWNHPDVLYEALQKENLANEQDLDLDDLNSTSGTRCSAPGIKGKSSDPANSKMAALGPLNPLHEKANQVITYEWAKDIMSNYQTGVLENSAKMVLLFHLIDESVKRGDKILVFSQSLSTLTVMEDFLSRRPLPIQTEAGTHNWVRNINYYRLDGSTSASERERLINQFNDPGNTQAWVFLLSTRAGCLGVNLIGANRVVVFDASWNPCHDAQAVCRVYRYGQRKPCHIYRLVCDFTLEKKIYDRQVSKQGMSDRVVDDLNPVLNFTRKEVESLLHFVEEEPDPKQSELVPGEDLEIVIKQACLLYPNLLSKQPFHHESLLMDRKDLKLTKAEKRAAKKSYEDEKRASVPYQRPSYAHYYPASDQRLTNIPAFSQRNWRPPPHLEEKPVASVRPVQSTPIPMMPRQVPMGVPSSSAGFPVNYLQKAGVYVQRVVTTTDIVIPGSNSSTDVQARIGAGESIHVIRGSKGTYIRTNDGRIFAIRSGKPRPPEGGATASREDSCPPLHSVSNGRASPQEPKRLTPETLPHPSPQDSPKLLREFQSNKDAVPAGDDLSSSGTPEPSGADRPMQNPVRVPDQHRQLGNDIVSSVDVQSLKRKLLESRTSKPPSTKRTSTSAGAAGSYPGFPLSSGFGFPSMGLNPALLGALGHMTPPALGSRSHLLQQAGQALGDLHAMFPTDPLGLGVSSSTLSSTCSTNTTSSSHAGMLAPSSSSVPSSSSSSTSSSLPPFLMNPGMASMLSGFSVPFSQPLFPGSLHPRGLSSTPTPASTASNFLSSSSLLGAAFSRPDMHPSLAENGGSSSDDDVIEVMGQ